MPSQALLKTAITRSVPGLVPGARLELVAVDSLNVHPKNPRRGNVAAIRASIRANQFFGAVLVQVKHDDGKPSRMIIGGEHRWRAAKAEKLAKVNVIWQDVTDAQALKIVLVDNRLGDLASYDQEVLVRDLQDLQASIGLSGTGFDEAALAEMLVDFENIGFKSAVASVAAESGVPAKSHARDLGDPKQQIKACLYAPQIAVFERALQATGEPNRAEALLMVCQHYLDCDAIEGRP